MTENGDGKPRLLLVDDKKSNIMVLNSALKSEYHTFFATDGQTALNLASEQLPDLILLDIQMPDMDGLEVCKALKADPKTEKIPIIFVTAMSEEEVEAAGLELGAVDYIAKPFNPTIVKLRVKNQLALKKYQDHLQDLVLERTAKLQKAKEAAECAARLKTKFLMVVSHELRTPLNSLLGFSDVMTSMVDGTALEYLNLIQNASYKLSSIVENALDYINLDIGNVRVSYKPFDIREAIDLVSCRVNEIYKEKGIAFSTEISEDTPLMFHGDEKLLQQILNQLLDNAFKFTSHGAVRLTVTQKGDGMKTGQLIFSIKDTGMGVPPEKQEEIFGCLTYAEDNMLTQHKGGIGIGLAICKSLLELLGGKIWMESDTTGSEFFFSIPY